MRKCIMYLAVLAVLSVAAIESASAQNISIWVRITTRYTEHCEGALIETFCGSTCVGWTMQIKCDDDLTELTSGSGCFDVEAPTVPLGEISVYGGVHNGEAVYSIVNGVQTAKVPIYTNADNTLVAQLVVDQYNNQQLLTGSQLE